MRTGEAVGSLLVVRGEDQADVEAWARADPYALAGLFRQVPADSREVQ